MTGVDSEPVIRHDAEFLGMCSTQDALGRSLGRWGASLELQVEAGSPLVY